MQEYISRKIRFRECVQINGWQIKIYTVSKTNEFDKVAFYQNAIKEIPTWLTLDNGFNNINYKVGFLILHPGAEGIFSIINWWVGENMLNSHVFLTDPKKPEEFKMISGYGLSSCVWELEIIHHEKVSWTNNILKQADKPNFDAYVKDVINTEV